MAFNGWYKVCSSARTLVVFCPPTPILGNCSFPPWAKRLERRAERRVTNDAGLPDVSDWLRGGQTPQSWANHCPLLPGCILRPGQSVSLLRTFLFRNWKTPFLSGSVGMWGHVRGVGQADELRGERESGQLPLLCLVTWVSAFPFPACASLSWVSVTWN